jgi:hypothetical protein
VRRAPLTWPVLLLVFVAGTLHAEDVRTSTVGLPVRINQLVLPGTELEVKPPERRTPVVLRIVNVWPHGTAFRYDLEYYGLEPGTFDLKDYLRRKDRSSAADLPAIPVIVQSVLPPGQVLPGELPRQPSPRLGGYRTALIAAGALWVAGLAAILLVGRRRRKAAAVAAKPLTLADRLRPLVEGAVAGRLPPGRLAELERTLIVYWGRRLNLRERKPAEALAVLRQHPEAGPLLRQLEIWLHQPAGAGKIDVAGLLAPYQNVPADGLEVEALPS